MNRVALEDVLPLTPFQEGMLFHALYDEQAVDVYITQLLLHLEGPLDEEVLRAAAEALLRRHQNLRAGFRLRKTGQPMQVIPTEVPLPWQVVDLTAIEPADRDEELARLVAADRLRRFDLATPPALRLTLVRLHPQRTCVMLTNHHILLDGWSVRVLLRELFSIYRRGGDASALPRVTRYREYLSWLARQDTEGAEAAWREALAGLGTPTRVAPA